MEITAAPTESGATLPGDEQIRRQSRPAPVAVWKWMNENHFVMKADRQFIRLVGFVVNPKTGIINRLNQVGLDAIGLDADVSLGAAVLACPAPNFIEHAAVQPAQESFIKHVAPSFERPAIR